MNKEDKIVLLAPFVVIILLLFAVGSLYMIKEGEKDKRASLQKQLDGVSIEKQNLEAKLKDMEIANAQVESNVKLQEEKVSQLAKDLEEEKALNIKNASKIQEKELEIQNLKGKMDEIRGEKLEALRTLDRLNEAYMSLKFQLENLAKTKEELDQKAKEINEREGVSLGTVVVKQSRS